MRGGLAILMVGVSALSAAGQDAQLERFEFQQIRMGVPFRLALYAPDEVSANRAARAAFRRVRHLNSVLSDYDPDSELSRLCRLSGPGRPVKVSDELLLVLSRSLALSRRTDGAFDVTVGPVVKLWRKARRNKTLPPADQLAAALDRVGYRQVRLDLEAGKVALMQEGMQLDLGGIAKGYAADEALRVLAEHGVTRALVDAGGDIVVGDPPPGKRGWTIGIASLDAPDGQPSRYLLLKNAAVATSGDAFQYIQIGGKRYSHLVDPQTGLGLTQRSSVTVIASDGITADSLASAVSVLGPHRGLELIDSRASAAAFVAEKLEEETELKTFASKRFGEYEVGNLKDE